MPARLALLSRASEGSQRCAPRVFCAARPAAGLKFRGPRRDVYCCQEPREFAAFVSDSQLGTEWLRSVALGSPGGGLAPRASRRQSHNKRTEARERPSPKDPSALYAARGSAEDEMPDDRGR